MAQTDGYVDGGEARPSAKLAPVRAWLYMIAGLVALMVIVGGATRLTDSGLSITEWKPILGAIPPLSEADWQTALSKYRQIPEYQQINKGMSLAEFKVIYWWEWSHRFLGRFVGVAFLIPFLFFWMTGRITRRLVPRLAVLFVLGGLQGLLGWYMVMSGLVDRVDVSQYRLAAHLGLAVLIFGAILWVAFGLREDGDRRRPPDALALSAAGLAAMIFLQIVLGAFVAGTDAGVVHNTWPLMDGRLIPEGLAVLSPWYLNLFENVLTVQFNHRIGAYILLAWICGHVIWVVQRKGEGLPAVGAGLLAVIALVQVCLGIWTLLAHVPIDIALLHQGVAIVLFGLAIRHTHQLMRG